MTEGDGRDWEKLYRPMDESQIPEWDKENPIRPGCVRMSGQDIYRFAVTKFGEVIASGLEATALKSEDISQFICHQSNIRILQKAMEQRDSDENFASTLIATAIPRPRPCPSSCMVRVRENWLQVTWRCLLRLALA